MQNSRHQYTDQFYMCFDAVYDKCVLTMMTRSTLEELLYLAEILKKKVRFLITLHPQNIYVHKMSQLAYFLV